MLYYFIGKLTNVSNEITTFMPGLSVGLFFSGTMTLTSDPANPKIFNADLKILAENQLVKAHSVGLDPMASFADCTATGPFSSPTMAKGYIDNVCFKFERKGVSLGSVSISATDGVTAGSATGSIQSIAVK